MLGPAPDSHAPPADLDVPAARRARDAYRAVLARGVREELAWEEATSLFALHHPAWPLPLVQREAARTVGALIAHERAAGSLGTGARPPLDLLRRLAAPAGSDDPAKASASVVAHPFRRAWRLPLRVPGAAPRPQMRRIEDLRDDALPLHGAMPSPVPEAGYRASC